MLFQGCGVVHLPGTVREKIEIFSHDWMKYRIDRYKTSYEMPIIAHPGAAPSVATLSYHRPLEAYVKALSSAGLVIDRLEEWSSHKTSDSGPRAKAENVAREEIPLFLALRVRPLIGH